MGRGWLAGCAREVTVTPEKEAKNVKLNYEWRELFLKTHKFTKTVVGKIKGLFTQEIFHFNAKTCT